MTTKAQKLKAARAGQNKCIIKIGKEEIRGTADLAKLVTDGYALKREMAITKDQLDAVNAKISEYVRNNMEDNGTAHVIVDAVDCAVTLKDSVKINDGPGLKKILGKRFKDLVKEKIEYKPEPRLTEMACDADEPLSDKIRGCMTIKDAKPGVAYKVIP